MWSVNTSLPVPEFVLTKGKTNVNSGVSIEEFKDVKSIDDISVVESEDHFCVLKTDEKEIKTEIPYDFKMPEVIEYTPE